MENIPFILVWMVALCLYLDGNISWSYFKIGNAVQ